jgi:tetratricopeptide (TPR) repeat protein
VDWQTTLAWADAEHEQRLASVSGPNEREDFRLAGIAGASWAAGLAALMLGRDDEARDRLLRAADEYATSWRAAPPGSWGRPIAMIRCRLMAGDHEGARADASAAVEAGALDVPGPIGGYCAALALLVLGRDEEAEVVAARIADEGLEPVAVANALGALARADEPGYAAARRAVLRSFEERDAFLEDARVADTVLVLDALALERGLDPQPLTSPLLPG